MLDQSDGSVSIVHRAMAAAQARRQNRFALKGREFA